MPESEGGEPQFTELPDQSGLYQLIGEIRETKNIPGVLSNGREIADMVTQFIPEIFRSIQVDYPDTRQEKLKADVNAGNLSTIKDLVFHIKEKRASELRTKGQSTKKDQPLLKYDTIWRALDGYVRRPAVPTGFEKALKNTNLNPQRK